jgi:CRISPR-associated protein Cmr1
MNNKMLTQSLTLTFVCPAFLGNAEQSSQWRTPPFKALLRQWWRIAYASSVNFKIDVEQMRQLEGELFGIAGDEQDSTAGKSKVRIRFSSWAPGKLDHWTAGEKINHPEVSQGRVGSDLYLGYGPLKFELGNVALKNGSAIDQKQSAKISIAYPENSKDLIEQALWLINQYGTLGGRSRNGWGSFTLTGLASSLHVSDSSKSRYTRSLGKCLELDWPHALASDDKGNLIWQTSPEAEWTQVVKKLAQIKIGLRTLFIFPQAKPSGIHDRHWLSYPVTKHQIADWDKDKLRLPNALRFKIRPDASGKLIGVIFHVAHKPPESFKPNPQALDRIWRKVYQYLDDPDQTLTRSPI